MSLLNMNMFAIYTVVIQCDYFLVIQWTYVTHSHCRGFIFMLQMLSVRYLYHDNVDLSKHKYGFTQRKSIRFMRVPL